MASACRLAFCSVSNSSLSFSIWASYKTLSSQRTDNVSHDNQRVEKWNWSRSVTAAAQRTTVINAIVCNTSTDPSNDFHTKLQLHISKCHRLTNDFTFFDSSAICCSLLARALASASLRPATRAATSTTKKFITYSVTVYDTLTGAIAQTAPMCCDSTLSYNYHACYNK